MVVAAAATYRNVVILLTITATTRHWRIQNIEEWGWWRGGHDERRRGWGMRRRRGVPLPILGEVRKIF